MGLVHSFFVKLLPSRRGPTFRHLRRQDVKGWEVQVWLRPDCHPRLHRGSGPCYRGVSRVYHDHQDLESLEQCSPSIPGSGWLSQGRYRTKSVLQPALGKVVISCIQGHLLVFSTSSLFPWEIFVYHASLHVLMLGLGWVYLFCIQIQVFQLLVCKSLDVIWALHGRTRQ